MSLFLLIYASRIHCVYVQSFMMFFIKILNILFVFIYQHMFIKNNDLDYKNCVIIGKRSYLYIYYFFICTKCVNTG
jgi:hypothetical protein